MFTPENKPEKGEFYFPDVEQMAGLVGAQPVWVEMTMEPDYVETQERMRKGIPVGRPAEVNLRNNHLQYIVTWYVLIWNYTMPCLETSPNARQRASNIHTKVLTARTHLGTPSPPQRHSCSISSSKSPQATLPGGSGITRLGNCPVSPLPTQPPQPLSPQLHHPTPEPFPSP